MGLEIGYLEERSEFLQRLIVCYVNIRVDTVFPI